MDDQMIELIKERKDDGMRILQQQYGGLMQYIVGNILKDTRDTEECISDIYLLVWNKIESYSNLKGKFSTWLTTITRNTAVNYLKRKSIASNTACAELTEDLSTPTTPELDLLNKERASQLLKTIQTLSIREQHLFYRKYYYLQSTAQIGAELGMTERSVEGKLYRLRKKLQKLLGGEFA